MTDKYANLVFVDVEAAGLSPASGVMTEFGAVHFLSRKIFHGCLYEARPSAENPAIPEVIDPEPIVPINQTMHDFEGWLRETVPGRPVFVSDNPAYDFMWIAYYFDSCLGVNPFGHSGRRISDFWAGLQGRWGETQSWKRFRVTTHDHNPVNDSMGNVEAFERILKEAGLA